MGEGLHILCSENLFIIENMEWVSFIIIAQWFQELISKVKNPRGVQEYRNAPVHRCAMKKKGVDSFEV